MGIISEIKRHTRVRHTFILDPVDARSEEVRKYETLCGKVIFASPGRGPGLRGRRVHCAVCSDVAGLNAKERGVLLYEALSAAEDLVDAAKRFDEIRVRLTTAYNDIVDADNEKNRKD